MDDKYFEKLKKEIQYHNYQLNKLQKIYRKETGVNFRPSLTPLLDELESGPWPQFVRDLKTS